MHRFPPPALLLLHPAATFAEVHCVTSSAKLSAALAASASNQQDDYIHIAEGHYVAPVGEGFQYVADGAEPENFNLEISGGWSALSIPQCNLQSGADAYDSLLAGNGGRVPAIYANTSSGLEVVIGQIGFTLGETTGHGGGLRVFAPAADVDVSVDRCAFIGVVLWVKNRRKYGPFRRIRSPAESSPTGC